MLDFVDKTFHQMTLSIKPLIIFTQHPGTLVRGNDRFNTTCQQILHKIGGCIATICNQAFKIKAIQQGPGLRDVMALSAGQTQAQGIAQSINCNVNFAAKAAATAPQGLFSTFFGAPAAQGWARTMVLSIIPFSISGSSAK